MPPRNDARPSRLRLDLAHTTKEWSTGGEERNAHPLRGHSPSSCPAVAPTRHLTRPCRRRQHDTSLRPSAAPTRAPLPPSAVPPWHARGMVPHRTSHPRHPPTHEARRRACLRASSHAPDSECRKPWQLRSSRHASSRGRCPLQLRAPYLHWAHNLFCHWLTGVYNGLRPHGAAPRDRQPEPHEPWHVTRITMYGTNALTKP
jgi:hypothetical protein